MAKDKDKGKKPETQKEATQSQDKPEKRDPIKEKREKIVLGNETVYNPRGISYSGAFKSIGIDNSFNIDDFKKNFKIQVISSNDELLVFDMIGVDASIANAFRRILIAEVPTMAIEKVYIFNNTSIIQDEVLAHRLGLIPLKADPRLFKFRNPNEGPASDDTLVFKLDVKCERIQNPKNDSEEAKFKNSRVLSKDLIWERQEDQHKFEASDVGPVFDDILIAKLRPGQHIQLDVHCEKGIGKDHAKFSPVATASYRLLPAISFKGEIADDRLEELVAKCPVRVYDIEDLGKGQRRPIVRDPRACTMCRECIRDDYFNQRIELARVRDHFIFFIETTGAMKPKVILQEAIKVLISKVDQIFQELDKTKQPIEEDVTMTD
eukprot:TRINITY_DN787_c0_g1_i1.p1 TRINITY_DN787_c0_g1~~TRINITY_DN787_c0_g1_i1.p1  ORF type:complete len:378 (+),score=79.79 TRINITY_DN787_c0_g1_i1:79-1212(+)